MQPERIGPYRIDGVLGSGGMGEVFLAYDERLKRPVAIKQLRADSQLTDERRARLRREAQAVALLNHPAIVQVYDIVTVDDIDHVVMEYVDGMPLASFLTDQSPQLSEILQLAQDIAEGLAEAHSKGVVHRDLKSENILVTHNGRAKILDFGLAKQLWSDDGEDSLSLEGALIGTSVAMSPEQAQGRKVDHRSDLFSFGILLYEMLTGHRPFLGATPLSTIHKIINEEPPPAREQAPELPEELFDLLDQLLEKKPRDRPQHALVVAEVLDRLRVWTMSLESGDSRSGSQAPIAVVGPVLAAAESDRQHLVRRRWMFAAVALVMLLAVLALVFYLPHRADAREPLRVAVPEVVSTAVDLPEAEAAAAVVRMTLLRGLTALKGVTTFDPFEVDELVDAEIGLGEALAADEILRASLRKVGADQIRVELRRVSVVDGELIETDAFEAPLDDMRLVSRVGYSKVHALYRGFDARREGSPFNVRLDDYQRFLVLREMALGGQKLKPAEEILDELEQIRGTSPLFLEVYLLEGRMARYLFRRTRNPMYRDRAFNVLEQVRELAPEDPRPLVRLIETAISAQDLSRAESLVEELEKLEPGDVELLTVRAQLEEAKGSVDRARELLQKAVQRKPALSYLMALADFELRVGQVGEAERHLEAVLERAPSNYMARSKLAQIELISGDPQRAAELYQPLVDLNPDAITVSNLGLAHLLLGRYREAAEAFRQARALDSEELSYVLNLADCYWLLGNKQEARRLYREVVAGVEKLEQTLAQPIDWPNRSLMSQALAHLGDDERAVRLTEEVLEQSAGDHRASFGAAIVYALVGLRTEARTHLERARSGGFSESWANLPWFTKLTASRAQNPADVL